MDMYTRKDGATKSLMKRTELVEKGWLPHEIEECWKIVKAEWSGEGLPPVGTVCEHVGDVIELVEVIAHSSFKGHEHDDLLVVFVTDSDVSFSSHSCFRPIRTAEQIAAQEQKDQIADLEDLIVNHWESLNVRDLAIVIYESNYRKQAAHNRVDYLSGHRWARQICLSAADELELPGGTERVLCTLRMGTQQKPEAYADGVREIIAIVEDAQIVQALRTEQ